MIRKPTPATSKRCSPLPQVNNKTTAVLPRDVICSLERFQRQHVTCFIKILALTRGCGSAPNASMWPPLFGGISNIMYESGVNCNKDRMERKEIWRSKGRCKEDSKGLFLHFRLPFLRWIWLIECNLHKFSSRSVEHCNGSMPRRLARPSAGTQSFFNIYKALR